MSKFLFYSLIFCVVGCSPQEEIPISIPLEIGNRKTVKELQDVPAFLDVEEVVTADKTIYFFSFELQNSGQTERLIPGKDNLICGFLNEELMYGMPILEDCELEGYLSRYLRSNFWPSNDRLHVTISGEVKERHPDDIFTGLPFSLSGIQKIKSCPVDLQVNQETIPLENHFWRLIGFVDNNGAIISSPTCENPQIGIVFHDRLLLGFPIEDPEARSFSIKSAVWIRPDQIFLVYTKSSENSLFLTRAIDPAWIPPRPATAPRDNFSNLTKDIFNKYDSLSRIFRFNEEISFWLNGNTLRLSNQANGINALFAFE